MSRPALAPLGAAAGILVLLASGCSSLLPGSEPPADVYDLSPPASFPADLPEVPWQLVIEEPVAAPGLETEGIAVREEPLQLAYYAGAQWAAPAPQMLQSLIVTAFENSDRIQAVGWQSVGLDPDHRLQSRLVRFEASYPDDAAVPVVHVRLDATLIEELGQGVLASRTFEAEEKAKSAAVGDVVRAYDQAVDAVLRDLVAWTLNAPDRPAS